MHINYTWKKLLVVALQFMTDKYLQLTQHSFTGGVNTIKKIILILLPYGCSIHQNYI